MKSEKLSTVIATAIMDAKASVCTHVPGCGGSETFFEYQKLLNAAIPYSFNEEVAYTICHGAALVGKRSACLIKTHGFAKAANSVVSSLSAGTLGGMVVMAFDDTRGAHSDNIFNAEVFIRGSEIPCEILNLKRPYQHIVETFDRSETMGLPIVILVKTDDINTEITYKRESINWNPIPYVAQPMRNVACPPLSIYQRNIFEAKIAGDSSWKDNKKVPDLVVPSGLSSPIKEAAESYTKIFEIFKTYIRERPVSAATSGDAGTSCLFAFPPYSCIDFCTYMGGSTSLAIGAHMAGIEKSWAITGDFSFIAAGQLGLLEAYLRHVPIKLLILDNGKASATGNQRIGHELLEHVLQPYSQMTTYLNPNDPYETLKEKLLETHSSNTLNIIVARCQ